MDVLLRPRRVVVTLGSGAAFLAVAHIAMQFWGDAYPSGLGGNLVRRLFDLDEEGSLSTLFAVVEWLLAVVLLTVIGTAERERGGRSRFWFGLAAVFACLTVDELVALHEILSGRLYAAFHTQGVLRFPWIVPYTFGLGVLALVYFRFLQGLPRRSRSFFLLSAVVFVGFSIGTEAIEGRHVTVHGKDFFYRVVCVPIEETGENVGLLIFIYALLDFIRTGFPDLRLRIGAN